MNSFDRNAVKTLRADIDAALAAVAAKHNVIVSLGTCRFSANEARFSKLTIVPQTFAPATKNLGPSNIGGVVDPYNTLESREYLNLGYTKGLPKETLGAQIRIGTSTMTIIGLKLSRRKYPVTVQGPNGGKYVVDLARVKAALTQAGYKL